MIERRIGGLSDEPRSGAPRTITDERVEEVVRTTLEETPPGATHWNARSETFKLSTDPYFVDKVRDVVGLYMSPPANAVVFCVDEKIQRQALDRSQPVLPTTPGRPERRTHDPRSLKKRAATGRPACSRP